MKLVFDLGNSRCKWALDEAGITQRGSLRYDDDFSRSLESNFRSLPRPQQVAAVSVTTEANWRLLTHWVDQQWGLEVLKIESQRMQLGVTNDYQDPLRLGADRWAALIAARARVSDAVCVVDCGTALTVDALDQNGVFRGGVIFPGLSLMRDALLRTAGVRDASGDDKSCLARNTADGVAAGTRSGLAGAIDRILDEQETAIGKAAQVLITGGDAPSVQGLLRHDAEHVPDLVLEGVALLSARGEAS